MKLKTMQKLTPPCLACVDVEGGFWGPRTGANRTTTIPSIYRQLKQSGHIDAWKLDWKPGQPNPPHRFWDSDVAKWLEAVAYSLASHPDRRLEALADGIINLVAQAQQQDGYLNLHYTVVKPEKRWQDLRTGHELYCAGHLTEAAVAYYRATGKRGLLDVMCRYVDYIDSVFGRGPGQKRGYPGHEEIELALVKLYHATGEPRYLKLAKYFVDERGRKPNYLEQENPEAWKASRRGTDYCQAHLPVREQRTVEGHAVRATYLYAGVADVAAQTGDRALLNACKRLWDNCTSKRMYVTGGVGSTCGGERFTFDYDLPNETAYAETCAAIGLVLWAHRMAQVDLDGRYADVMERCLYNGVLSGVSLNGKGFFYVNPLAASPEASAKSPVYAHVKTVRPEWFGCACCPPNVARLIASLGKYAYSQGKAQACIHLYVQGRAELQVGGQTVCLTQRTDYPWREKVLVRVDPQRPATFTLALRIPAWCRGAGLTVNGEPVDVAARTRRGYARIRRRWAAGDEVALVLPMPVERIEAHPRVRADCGCVALMRGPMVYCLEEVDNGPDLADVALPRRSRLTAKFDRKLLGGVVVLSGKARRRCVSDWGKAELYRPAGTRTKTVTIRAVPYCVWANRKPGEMRVWIREA